MDHCDEQESNGKNILEKISLSSEVIEEKKEYNKVIDGKVEIYFIL